MAANGNSGVSRKDSDNKPWVATGRSDHVEIGV
jgi:hypothetical protein